MHNPLGVHCTQGIHNRNKYLGCFFPVKLATMLANIDVKTGAFHIVHHEICRTIFFKIGMDTDYIFISDKLCKCLGFIKKAVLTICKAFTALTGKRNDRSSLPGSHSIGEEFLYSNLVAGLMICCGISDTKAALAQYFIYDVLPSENCPLGQRHGILIAHKTHLPLHRFYHNAGDNLLRSPYIMVNN